MASIDLGMVTAYAYAVAGGYTGSEQDFEDLLGNIAIDLEEIENLSVTVTTLPEGSQATASYNNGVLALGIPKGDTGATGAEGPEGPTGPTGNGIASIAKTGTAGNVDTYTITYTNGNTTTFTVTNGAVTSVDGQTGDVVLSHKANIDGYYEQMTVGNAEQLISSTFVEDTEPYNFRTSGGTADIGDRARNTIVGGSLAFNQLLADPNFSDNTTTWRCYNTSNATFSRSGNVGTLTYTATSSTGGYAFGLAQYAPTSFIQNHKYVISIDLKTDFATKIGFELGGSLSVYTDISANTWTTVTRIASCPTTATLFEAKPTSSAIAVGNTFSARNALCIDLTQLFGTTIADYIYTLEQGHTGDGVAWFKKYFPNDYYPYNAGTLKHVETSEYKTVGFNQFNKSAMVVDDVYINNNTGNATSNNTSKATDYIRVLPNTDYFIESEQTTGDWGAWYDSNKNYISGITNYTANQTPAQRIKTSPANAHYMRLTMVYNNNGNPDTFCVNLSWSGTHDGEYEPYETHSYSLDSDLVLRGIPKKDADGKLYYDGDTYEADGTVTRYYGIRAYQAGDATDGLTMITDGTNTVYKLDTPTTETADPFQTPQIVNDWGTEEFVGSEIPVGHSTEYLANLRDKLQHLPDLASADGVYAVEQDGTGMALVPIPSAISAPPTTDGTYTLKCTVSGGTATFSWEA